MIIIVSFKEKNARKRETCHVSSVWVTAKMHSIQNSSQLVLWSSPWKKVFWKKETCKEASSVASFFVEPLKWMKLKASFVKSKKKKILCGNRVICFVVNQ